MHIDIFSGDAFSMGTLTDSIEKMPYSPGLLRSMGLFTPRPVRTEYVAIESKNHTLAIIQTSERGGPLEQGRRDKRSLRRFDTVRLAKADRVSASEIQGIRAYGTETELMQAADLVADSNMKLRGDLELTFEKHRLGAIQGKVLDADGTEIIDWFDEWDIAVPTAIEFKLDTAGTEVEAICRDIQRRQARASQGLWTPSTYTAALAGDLFFDKLTRHKTVKETYLNQAQAASLRASFGPAAQNMTGAFATFNYGGILFINYRGVDTFTDTPTVEGGGVESIGVKSYEAKFFPVGAPGVFQVAYSPGETFDTVNTLGREMYAMLIPDRKRNAYVDLEVYSYPLFMCTRPEMLLTGVANTIADPDGA